MRRIKTIFLRDAVPWLATLAPAKIGVSIDAASSDDHDRIRGVSGAWTATVDGVRHATEALAPSTSIAITSVLMSRREPLDGMPKLLRSLGVNDWIVTPLQRIGREQPGGPAGDRQKLYRDLLILRQMADDAGIGLTVDDELNCLHHGLAAARRSELHKLRVRTLPKGADLFRLVPNGQCSMNLDILKQVTLAAPRWRPSEIDAADFLEGLKRASTVEYAHAA
jgi:hypothetical protein